MAERMLAVWCPDWPVRALAPPGGAAPTRDGLLHLPVALVHANRVVACSPAARAEGVEPGLRRREAQRRCPGLALLPHDLDRDARAFEPVVAAVERLAPRVEVARPGACAFPVRGAARYHGGEAALALLVAATVDEAVGVQGACLVGVADGRFAAGLAAQEGQVVPRGGTAAFLARFGVEVLERPDLADLLVRLGLQTLGQLAALPRADLTARFGPEGTRAHRLASGLDEHPPAARRPPPDLRAVTVLDPAADRVDVAAFAAKSLADELVERLARLGLACTCLRIEAVTEHGEALARVWRHEDGLSAAQMAERVRWQLEGWLAGGPASRPTGPIARLALVPDEVVAGSGRQLGFWGEERAAAERAARGLARVQGLLGAGAVRAPQLRGGRGPADRVDLALPLGAEAPPAHPPGGGQPPGPGMPLDRRVPEGWVGREGLGLPVGLSSQAPRGRPEATRARRSQGPAPWPGQVPPPSPATVHPAPLPAELLDGEGAVVTVSGRGLLGAEPARLWANGADGWATVVDWAGPWPVEERWWDPATRRRAARLQVLTAEGVAFLLALSGGHWWVEATYD